MFQLLLYSLFFFFNDTATTEIYTLSLHDALPISYAIDWGDGSPQTSGSTSSQSAAITASHTYTAGGTDTVRVTVRSEEHTSELQSHSDLVCRLLLEKKKKT